ncbi:MAG TPA: hypothetical protein VLW65_06145 [Bryobacteraceae bacterium]|nr:hypothetical protein [Bryobacteraceae bacterium]
MESSNEGMRDRLLSRLPQPGNLADYRNEVGALLEKNEKRFRREKWYSGALWVYAVLLGTAFLWLGADTRHATTLGFYAIFALIFGAVELLKHFINRSRVELLKEIKQVQLQVLELQAAMGKESV